MNQPSKILDNGTRIKTNVALEPTTGMMIKQHHLDARKPNAEGNITGLNTANEEVDALDQEEGAG